MDITKKTEEELVVLTDMLKALAHPVRLSILCHLNKGEKNVSQLESILNKGQALISQQLKILKFNDLIKMERRDGFSVYSINTEKSGYISILINELCHLINSGKEN